MEALLYNPVFLPYINEEELAKAYVEVLSWSEIFETVQFKEVLVLKRIDTHRKLFIVQVLKTLLRHVKNTQLSYYRSCRWVKLFLVRDIFELKLAQSAVRK